jgi:hypothetical protein
MLSRFTKLAILFLVCGLLASSALLGQTSTQIARAIERLNKELQFTKELVQAFRNASAQDLVIRAEKLRDEALAAIRNNQPIIAANKIQAAFSNLEQAQKRTLAGPVNRWRSRLEELLQRAEHEVLGRRNKEAERVLRRAKENFSSAQNAITARRYAEALDHYQAAVEWAERSLQLVRNSDSNNDYADARRRFETLKDRAREMVDKSGNSAARRIYDQALRLFRSAEDALSSNRLQAAKQLYNQSILLLLRAIDLTRGDARVGRQDVDAGLDQLQQLIDRVQDALKGIRRAGPRRVFDRGLAYARQARAAAGQGKYDEALLRIELAENMLRRAEGMARQRGVTNRSNRVLQEIENTQAEISDARRNFGPDTPQDVEVLVKMAQFALDRADRAAKAGFSRVALESVLAAQRFLTKAARVRTSDAAPSISSSRLDVRMRQLDAAIAEAEDLIGIENPSWNRRLLQASKDIRQMAIESMEKGNMRAAEEAVEVALGLVRKSSKNISEN